MKTETNLKPELATKTEGPDNGQTFKLAQDLGKKSGQVPQQGLDIKRFYDL